MATFSEYAHIASAAYNASPSQWDGTPPGNMVDGWDLQFFGFNSQSGLQGGIWRKGNDIVVGYAGTTGGTNVGNHAFGTGKTWKDIKKDWDISTGEMPRYTAGARKLIDFANFKAGGGNFTVSVTGHSLGGGISQTMGVLMKVGFVTFNAPPMDKSLLDAGISASEINAANGFNFRVMKDPVSMHVFGRNHVGQLIELQSSASLLSRHLMGAMNAALDSSAYANSVAQF